MSFYVKRDIGKLKWEYVVEIDDSTNELLCADNPFQATMFETQEDADEWVKFLSSSGLEGFYVSPIVGFGTSGSGDFVLGDDRNYSENDPGF